MPSRRASSSATVRPVSTCSATTGACSLSATRLAWRTNADVSPPSPMQTNTRSPAAHGPAMAFACMCASNWSSTRCAVRRSVSSRKAVRLPGEKKWRKARSAWRGT